MANPVEVWRRALDWVETQLPRFGLPGQASVPELMAGLKALGELARTAEVLCRQPARAPEAARRGARLLTWAWEELGRGERLEWLLGERPEASAVGTIYAIFTPHGMVHEGVRARLLAEPPRAAALVRRDPDRPPRTSYGPDAPAVLALGLAQAWRTLALPPRWSEADLLRRTVLAAPPEGRPLTQGEAYSITHTIFFVTDWGQRPGRLAGAARAQLARHAPAWQSELRDRGDLDLYAEMVVATACAGLPGDAEAEQVLRRGQEEDGLVPLAAWRAQLLPPAPATASADDRRFAENHHTTLAALLASFAVSVGLARAPDGMLEP
jgi:hypothetical protein